MRAIREELLPSRSCSELWSVVRADVREVVRTELQAMTPGQVPENYDFSPDMREVRTDTGLRAPARSGQAGVVQRAVSKPAQKRMQACNVY